MWRSTNEWCVLIAVALVCVLVFGPSAIPEILLTIGALLVVESVFRFILRWWIGVSDE